MSSPYVTPCGHYLEVSPKDVAINDKWMKVQLNGPAHVFMVPYE